MEIRADKIEDISVKSAAQNQRNADDPEKVKKAVKDFEAIFINYMLKTMREGISKSGLLDGGKAEEIYTSMMDEEMAKVIAYNKGIGLANIMLKEFGIKDGHDGFIERVERLMPSHPVNEIDGRDETGKTEPLSNSHTLVFKDPVEGGVLSSGYGYRYHPFEHGMRFHHGIDIAAKEGTPIYPAAKGAVIFSGWRDGYGNVVEIKHENDYITRYGHNAKNLVKEGDIVDVDMQIAEVGSTGRSTGPHLHFEIKKDGLTHDPVNFVRMAKVGHKNSDINRQAILFKEDFK